VAAREIRERSRSRAFALSTLAIVALVLAGVIVPALGDKTSHMRAGMTAAAPAELAAGLRDAARAADVRLSLRRYTTTAAGEAALDDRRVDVLLDGDAVVWRKEPDGQNEAILAAATQRVRFAQRASALGLTGAQAAQLLAPAAVPARTLHPAAPDAEAREAIAFVSFLVLLLMLLLYGTAVAEGVAQEKGTRVMELLVCRVRPRDLLAGKVIGIGLVGLAQMLVALLAAGIAIVAVERIDVPAAVPTALASAVLWFALGYAFWSVAMAAVAALVSRVEDLQAAIAPLTWTITLCALTAPVAAEEPSAWYSVVVSLLPLTAPFAMPARIAVADVPGWEVALAAGLILAGAYGLIRLGGAVYAGSVLRTGARPRLRDVWRAARSG
jgi:ABC-2 type transport system permease protein